MLNEEHTGVESGNAHVATGDNDAAGHANAGEHAATGGHASADGHAAAGGHAATGGHASSGSHHGQSEDDKTKFREMDCTCFNAIRWSHLITFSLQILGFVLKFKERYNTSQMIQGMVIPWFYMGAGMYTIFQVKYNKDNWAADEEHAHGKSPTHDIRAWLLIECMTFFVWILCSMFFTVYAYIFKVKSACKSTKVMEMDDNVWNDKDTDDFLRYLKFEYFMCTYFMLKIFLEIYIGFVPRQEILTFGKNEFEPIGIIFICLLVQSTIAVLNLTLILRNSDDDMDADDMKSSDLYTK